MATVPPKLLRRAISIPGLTLGLIVLVVLSVVVVPVLAIIDQLIGHRRFRYARVWLLIVGAVFAEFFSAVRCGLLWIRFIGRIGGEPSMRAHTTVQRWWVHAHLRNFRWFAGLHLVIDDPGSASEGHAVVIARHMSHADALLPAFVFGNVGDLHLRYTLKDTLQWAPALDLAANRLPNVFVDRAPGPDSPVLGRLETLAAGCHAGDVCVIFPEGTFYTPERLDRAATRLGATRPDLEPLARSLRFTLPPRPAGTLAMLQGAAHADVVFLSHVGIEGFGSMREMMGRIPLDEPWRARMWRYPRAEIPESDHDRTTWLLERWAEVDAWIADQIDRRAHGNALSPGATGATPEEIVA